MKSILKFDFLVNKEKQTINIIKEFAAPNDMVWDCWTKSELLDQWWAPKPFRNETISMSFTEGGTWHYAMISPQGDKHYCKASYKKIEIQKMFSYKDAFCNENGQELESMPGTNWVNTFKALNDTTIVDVVLHFESVEALENVIKMGFKEGFLMGLQNLEQYLENQIKLLKQEKKK